MNSGTLNLSARYAIWALVILVSLASLLVFPGVAAADWNIGDRIWANSCNGAQKDPVNVMFRGWGWLSNTLAEYSFHLPSWSYSDGSDLWFKDHGVCTAQDAHRGTGSKWSLARDHIRFEDGDYDTVEEWWTAAAVHRDECIPHIGTSYDLKRDQVRTAFINGGHFTEPRWNFSSGQVWVVCGEMGWWESWSGQVAWISHPGNPH